MDRGMVSTKFKYISENTLRLTQEILKSEDLIKYIYHVDSSPLNNNLAEVSSSQIIKNNFTFAPFNNVILEDTKVMVFFYPFRSEQTYDYATTDDIYQMDIIVPYQYWLFDDLFGFRAYAIADEVSKAIDGKSIAGIGRTLIINWESYKVNNTHAGLTLLIKVTNSSYTSGR